MMKEAILLGDEAVALAAVHAGITGAYAYPGTPSTEIMEFLHPMAKKKGTFKAAWAVNEKTAYEEALGCSFAGGRAIVSMKHVGLNVAADPFMNSAMVDIHGGLVLAVADDPGMHSSQNEQDSRCFADFALTPAFEPSSQQEAYDMTRGAFDLSEKVHLPVMIRLVTRLAHSRSKVMTREPKEKNPVAKAPDPTHTWTLLPSNARKQYVKLLGKFAEMEKLSDAGPYNTLELNSRRTGVITNGIALNYYREILPELKEKPSHLHIGFYPLPKGLISKLFDHCDQIMVIEEGMPFIERKLTGIIPLSKPVHGKLDGCVPATGELNPRIVLASLDGQGPKGLESPMPLPTRPPQLCQGCPHADMYTIIKEIIKDIKGTMVTSDIGCYTLGALPPYNAIESCVCMGASVSMAKGASDAGYRPVIATIGDSTFMHSGITPLIDAIEDNADMTLMILDNAGVAMTGGQPTKGTGDRLVNVVKGLGMDPAHLRVVEAHPKQRDANLKILQEEVAYKGLSVIIARRECIEMAKKRK
jgi:indolepyruvate ferredoxin oxidoreductase alpha subunit